MKLEQSKEVWETPIELANILVGDIEYGDSRDSKNWKKVVLSSVANIIEHRDNKIISQKDAECEAKLKEQRKEILEIIKSNQKEAFTDDGGNDGWYVDDLVAEAEALRQENQERYNN